MIVNTSRFKVRKWNYISSFDNSVVNYDLLSFQKFLGSRENRPGIFSSISKCA